MTAESKSELPKKIKPTPSNLSTTGFEGPPEELKKKADLQDRVNKMVKHFKPPQ